METIEHVFKPPAKEPNGVVTLFFLAGCAIIPLFALFRGISVLGMNTNAFPVSPKSRSLSILFFGGIVVYACIMVMFFIGLNLFQTIALALTLAAPLSFIGNKVLCDIRDSGELSFK